jgi:hypothetical protein
VTHFHLSYQKVCHWLCLLVISESVSLTVFTCHIRKCVTDCVYLSYQKVCHWLCLLVISESVSLTVFTCHIRYHFEVGTYMLTLTFTVYIISCLQHPEYTNVLKLLPYITNKLQSVTHFLLLWQVNNSQLLFILKQQIYLGWEILTKKQGNINYICSTELQVDYDISSLKKFKICKALFKVWALRFENFLSGEIW